MSAPVYSSAEPCLPMRPLRFRSMLERYPFTCDCIKSARMPYPSSPDVNDRRSMSLVFTIRSMSCEASRKQRRVSASSSSMSSKSAKSRLTYFPALSPSVWRWNIFLNAAMCRNVSLPDRASIASSSVQRSNVTPFAFSSSTCSSGVSMGLRFRASCTPSSTPHAMYVVSAFSIWPFYRSSFRCSIMRRHPFLSAK